MGVVTRSELLELSELEERYAEATKTLAELEKPLKAARLALIEKVLGVCSTPKRKAAGVGRLETLLEMAGLEQLPLPWLVMICPYSLDSKIVSDNEQKR